MTERSNARQADLVRRATIIVATWIAVIDSTAALRAQSLSRAKIVLPNTISVDVAAQTVTLPLLRGHAAGNTIRYIVADSSNEADAKRRGAIYASLIANIGESP